MAIVASLSTPGLNLFSSLPLGKDPTASSPPPPPPPIPIPKYPPPLKKSKNSANPAFKIPHLRTKYYKPVKYGSGVIASDGDRSVLVGESGVSYLLPGAPFEFQFSYSETPKVKPLAIREPTFLPFAPPTMPRPWTGKPPLKTNKKKILVFDSFNPPPAGKKGVKYVEMPDPYPFGKFPEEGKSKEEILKG